MGTFTEFRGMRQTRLLLHPQLNRTATHGTGPSIVFVPKAHFVVHVINEHSEVCLTPSFAILSLVVNLPSAIVEFPRPVFLNRSCRSVLLGMSSAYQLTEYSLLIFN